MKQTRMKRRLGTWVAFVLLAGVAGALPSPDYPVIDSLDYPDAETAAAAWIAHRGTAAPSIIETEGRTILRLPCNFAGTDHPRAVWDLPVELDLTTQRGIQFRFRCPDPLPVASFMVYLRSGDGWHVGDFLHNAEPVPGAPGWHTVALEKPNARSEETPRGWARIDRIRIAAWRGADTDTEIHLADLGTIPGDPAFVLVRGEQMPSRTPSAYVRNVDQALSALGLAPNVTSDRDLTTASLRDARVVVLPYNPEMPSRAVEVIAEFMDRGGKLMAFFDLPPALAERAHLRMGRVVGQEDRGDFHSIHPVEPELPGLPDGVAQASWNIRLAEPAEGRGRVAAEWRDREGRTRGPAMVITENAAFMTHVLLADDLANKRLLVLAMAGHLDPDAFQRTAARHVTAIGLVGPYPSFEALRNAVEAKQAPEAVQALRRAEDLRNRAHAQANEGEYPAAVRIASDAQRAVMEAHAALQQSRVHEFRGFWCHDAYGVPGRSWEDTLAALARNGFTAVFPNVAWGGVAFYDSDVLPEVADVMRYGNALEECIAAARRHGIEVHAWKVNWKLGDKAPASFRARMKQEGRTQVRFDGAAEDDWLCPTDPRNQRLEIDAMVEMAQRYDVDGIHFDYIRYPGSDLCFCAGCRKRFEEVIGQTVRNWPEEVRDNPGMETRWLEFRRQAITRVVAAVHERVQDVRPDVQISAAVFPDWPLDRNRIGQDWRAWCEAGIVDFVCPMNYTPFTPLFEGMVSRQGEWAGDTPVYPGIGLSTWTNPADGSRLIEQINAVRRLGAPGFQIFNLTGGALDDVAPLLRLGITRSE